ncbi:hypothetical protein BGZ76_003101 [Entomortierella beljakovae]|nr:hypothetical protein BGZ76_003101 [Entomortierella beljakovae]
MAQTDRYALLPGAITALLNSNDAENSTTPSSPVDLTKLCAYLKRIPRSTWVRLGSECHNAGFAIDAAVALKSNKAATSSVSMFSTAATAARAAALLYSNGVPKIIGTIERQQTAKKIEQSDDEALEEGEEQELGPPVLWELYKFYSQHCSTNVSETRTAKYNNNNKDNKSRSKTLSLSSSSSSSTEQQPWQLEFLKSACPEVIVMAFLDTFLEHGPKRGFERDMPTGLVEALDFEWRSSSGTAKRSVLALIQTLISCRRYAKNHLNNSNSSTKQPTAIKGLGIGTVNKSAKESNNPGIDEDQNDQTLAEKEREEAYHQLALKLSEAYTALEVFFETERGRNLPKLITLYQQELNADTKLQSRSGQSGPGIDRGIKRPGTGTIGSGSGLLGSSNTDPMDSLVRKRFKSGNDVGPLGSTTSMLSTSPPPMHSLTPNLPSTSMLPLPVSANVVLKSSSQFVDQALAGYASAATVQPIPAMTSTLSSINAQQQAKLNNPLWSPIMGLTHSPQWPTKYAAQVESELERWILLLGHMDGAVFSEKLVGLIKSVYPSDQKFLLDQILIDYMCWEGSGGSERESEEPAFLASNYLKEAIPILISGNEFKATAAAASGSISGTDGNNTGVPKSELKTGEWIMETIMSTLVSLVIKPEESSNYLEPGSKKWVEVIEITNDETSSLQENVSANGARITPSVTSGDLTSSSSSTGAAISASATPLRPSAAHGGAKKRRVRNLYNRRVSPFYAVLAMFQSKRVVGRVTGMLYSSSEELASHYESSSTTTGPTLLLKQVRDTSAFPKPAILSGETEEPEPGAVKLDRRRLKKLKRKEKKILSKLRHQQQYQMKQGPGGGGSGDSILADLDADDDTDSRLSSQPGSRMDTDDQSVDLDAQALEMKDIEEEDNDNADNNNGGKATNNHGRNLEQGADVKREETTQMEGLEQDTGVEAPTSPHVLEEGNQDDLMVDVAEEEDALELAKQVEASRIVCQAPFKVLMFILQYLTRANHSGALDSWITDALSATLPTLQEQYFEWMFCSLAASAPPGSSLQAPSVTSSVAEGNQDLGENVVFEEEILRLLAVLVAAQGVGYDPAKTAMETVERARQSIIDSLNLDQELQDSSYWTRAKTLLSNR